MTRVNIIDPVLLTDQHLVAERLEITWVVKSAKRSLNSKKGLSVNPKFTMGKGHVSFFHNKLGYIRDRFDLITKEMIIRGMNPKMPWPDDSWVPSSMKVPYSPTDEDYSIIKDRIKQRLSLKPSWYRYYGVSIDESWINEIY